MSAHTPGPWKAGPTMHGKWHCIFAPSNAGEVARTESAANARLIAAAPELLSSLKTIMQLYVDDPENEDAKRAYALLDRIKGDA